MQDYSRMTYPQAQGAHAAEAGKTEDDCPYSDRRTREAREWLKGFREAAQAPVPENFEEKPMAITSEHSVSVRELVEAFREVMEPANIPRPELVTVGETSDPKLDAKVYCPQCLGDRGSRWNSHSTYWWGYDPEKPDRPKRHSVRTIHPDSRKTMTYDAQAVKAGLEAGTHGKQCLQCGAKLATLVA